MLTLANDALVHEGLLPTLGASYASVGSFSALG